MADYDKIEVKWNADEEKLKILLSIERELTSAFLNYELDEIYTLLRVYRIHASTKFSATIQQSIKNELDELSLILDKYKRTRNKEIQKKYYLTAENYFLKISNLLKEAGIYFRENKSASTAILQRG